MVWEVRKNVYIYSKLCTCFIIVPDFIFIASLSFEFVGDTKSTLLKSPSNWENVPFLVEMTGIEKVFARDGLKSKMFVRSETKRILSMWFTEYPYLLAWGSPGTGKSMLAQLSLCVSLVRDEYVVVHQENQSFFFM